MWAQVGIIAGMVMVGFGALLFIVAYAKRYEWNDGVFICFAIACFATAMGLGVIGRNAGDYYKITHAPRLYVVEELRRLL